MNELKIAADSLEQVILTGLFCVLGISGLGALFSIWLTGRGDR